MRYNKLVVLSILMILVAGLSAFMPKPDEKFKNLKVLPKDISHEDLDKVMDGYKKALGVKCNFCHAAQADNPKRLDFVSDAKPEKETARMMMRMTSKINKKYFHIKDLQDGKALLAVSCITCHRGNAHPEEGETK
jgi:cytochrome c2